MSKWISKIIIITKVIMWKLTLWKLGIKFGNRELNLKIGILKNLFRDGILK